MKKYMIMICLLISASLFAEMTAVGIMMLNDSLPEAESSSNVTTMVLINKKNNRKNFKMALYTRNTEEGVDSFIEILLPADVRGTKFLTIGDDKGEDEQRLFLPSLKRTRLISSSSRDSKFMGSDITYYDMESKNIEDFTYRLLGEERVNGKECWKIESIPMDSDAPYEKIISYISKEDYFGYRQEMYDEGAHVKTVEVVEARVFDGVIIPVKTAIDNLEDEHQTLLVVSDIELNNNPDGSLFTVQALR